MLAQAQKAVAVLAEQRHRLCRGQVPVRVGGVGVQIALVPLAGAAETILFHTASSSTCRQLRFSSESQTLLPFS